MKTITILECVLSESPTSSYKTLDFKVYDSEDSALKQLDFIAGNLTRAGKEWKYISNNHGISCQLTEEYYPKQEWIVRQEPIRTF